VPTVPFLGVYLTDLTFVALGNLDFIPDTHYINFDKRMKVAQIINEMQKYQQNPFNLTSISDLIEYLRALGSEKWMTESELYEKSRIAEPIEDNDD
jgi:son of sevenless-like protein